MGPAHERGNSFDRIRRRAYLCACLIGAPVDALGWWLADDPVISTVYGALALGIVATLVLILSPAPLRVVEIAAFTGMAVLFVARLAVVVFLTSGIVAEVGEVVTSLVILSCVYVLAFLIFPRKLALGLACVVVLVTGLLLLAGVLFTVPHDLPHGGMPLIKSFAMQGVLVPLLYVLAVTKERMSAAQAREEALTELATTDPLIGIPNRRYLIEALDDEVARTARSGRPFSVVLVDLDGFKTINDTHGHAVGDQVLCHVAATLDAEVRATDVFGRWGGEEFLVIVPEGDVEVAQRLAHRFRDSLHAHPVPGIGVVTASFGVAAFDGADTWEQTISAADRAMYAAKDAGRDRVFVDRSPVTT